MSVALATSPLSSDAKDEFPSPAGVPIPILTRCAATAPPELPDRWRAVALMMPFEGDQLLVGEFVFDRALPALRAMVYGLETGTADLLITSTDTYQLSGPHDAPTSCRSLGHQYDPPSNRWLSAEAQCVGAAPIMDTPVEWWRMPAQNSGAIWHWLRNGVPWRSLMTTPARDPAVIGEYAMTYFPVFEQVSDTNLARLRDFCRDASAANPAEARRGEINVRSLMLGSGNNAAEAERTTRIRALMPRLNRQACSDVTPSRWPRRFIATTIMVPTRFDSGPFPSEIYYNGDAMLTRMHEPDNPSVVYDGLLKGDRGYNIQPGTGGAPICRQEYPGIVKPDWLTTGKCECKGVIETDAQLSANETVAIRACPASEPANAFWVWYTTSGRPLTFLSTVQTPNGLILADYQHWSPDAPIAPGALEPPAVCMAYDNPARLPPPARVRLDVAYAARCSACHATAGPQR